MPSMNETVAFAKLFIEAKVSPEGTRAALNRLRRSAELTNAVTTVVGEFGRINEVVSGSLATFKRFYRQPQIENIKAVAALFNHPESPFLKIAGKTFAGRDLNPAPHLTGADLIELGLKPGPKFKEILFAVETAQLNTHPYNEAFTREDAVELAKRLGGVS